MGLFFLITQFLGVILKLITPIRQQAKEEEMTQYLAIALMSAGSLGRKRAGYLGIFTGGQSRDILRGGTTLAVQPRGGPLTTFADPAPCPSLAPRGDRKRAPGVTHPQQVRPIRSLFHPTQPKLTPTYWPYPLEITLLRITSINNKGLVLTECFKCF